jgi:hypothetical protein
MIIVFLIVLIILQNNISWYFQNYLSVVIIETYQECLVYEDAISLNNENYMYILNTLISSYLENSQIKNVKMYYSFDELIIDLKIEYQIFSKDYVFIREISLNEK